MWRVVVGEEVSPHEPTITPPPTTTHHIVSCDICYAKMCGTRLILIEVEKPNNYNTYRETRGVMSAGVISN